MIERLDIGKIMKKFDNLYVKYVVKSPLFLIMIAVFFVTLIIYLACITKTNIYKTYDATIDKDTVIIAEKIDIDIRKLYAYVNRDDQVYPLEILKQVDNEQETIFYVNDIQILSELPNVIKVDVPIAEITLLERIFVRGGKMNE